MNTVAELWSEYQGTLPNQMNLYLKTRVRQAFIAGAEAMRDRMNVDGGLDVRNELEAHGQQRLTLVNNGEDDNG